MTAPKKPFALYAITKHGVEIAARIAKALPGAELYASERVRSLAPADALPLALPMGPVLERTFTAYDCHVFVISVGAVVRMIAPLLKDKKQDPAVVCVDDAARFSICVLSGHVGRGNSFTQRIADVLGATAVITTASDVRGTLTVDILGRELGWVLDDIDRNVTLGCAAVVNASPVAFVQECGEPDWWPEGTALPEGVRYFTSLEGVDPNAYEMLLVVSDRDFAGSHPEHWKKSVIYRPKTLVLGVGCDKNTPVELVERGVAQFLVRRGLSEKSVRAIASVDQKRDEPALVALAERRGWQFETYPAAVLDEVEGIENPSATVKKYVGTRSVAEAACLLCAGAKRLLVPKETYTEPGAERSMTIAVSRVPHPARGASASTIGGPP